MSQTIAITGATGFVGRHTVKELLRRGHRLVALVRDPSRARLPGEAGIVEGDLENTRALADLVQGADAVVHLAGAIAAVRPEDFFRVNTLPTRALAQAAAQAGVRRFVHVSSLAARQQELSSYAASKFLSEDAVKQFDDVMDGIVLRACAIYGPGDQGTLPLIRELTRGIAMIPGRRGARFSLIYVEDFARVIAEAVSGGGGGVREVSDGTPGGYGWDDLIAVAEDAEGGIIRPFFVPKPVALAVAAAASGVARLTGKSGMVNPGKVKELYHTDWVTRGEGWPLRDPIKFDQGFRRTLGWYREEGWVLPARGTGRRPANSLRKAEP